MANLKLKVVSQEKQLIDTEVSQITAPTSEGEITVLPGHIPLYTKMQDGVARYLTDGQEHFFVVSKGFMSVSPEGEVVIMVDSAVDERDISEEKAEAAIKAAQETMSDVTASERELIMAEANLRRAMWEIRLAQRTKKSSI
jgi:F-type H+-transporting ATPase subunit epsilon